MRQSAALGHSRLRVRVSCRSPKEASGRGGALRLASSPPSHLPHRALCDLVPPPVNNPEPSTFWHCPERCSQKASGELFRTFQRAKTCSTFEGVDDSTVSRPTMLLLYRCISRSSPLHHPDCSPARSGCAHTAQTNSSRHAAVTCLCSHTTGRGRGTHPSRDFLPAHRNTRRLASPSA